MATIKSGTGKGKYCDSNAKADVIAYIANPSKTPHSYIGGYGVDFDNPASSMNAVSASFGKSNGVQLRHFIISFLTLSAMLTAADTEGTITSFMIC